MSARLQSLRESRGLTQQQVVDRAFPLISSAQVLSNYENARRAPDFETLCKFASIYGVTTDYLLGVSDDENPQSREFSEAVGLSEFAVSMIMDMPKDNKRQLNKLLESWRLIILLASMNSLESATDLGRNAESEMFKVTSEMVKDFGADSDMGLKFKDVSSRNMSFLENDERYARFNAIDAATRIIDHIYPLTNWERLSTLCAYNSNTKNLEEHARSINEDDFADFIAGKGEWSGK